MGKITKTMLKKLGLDNIFSNGEFTLRFENSDDWRVPQKARVYDWKLKTKTNKIEKNGYYGVDNINDALGEVYWEYSKKNKNRTKWSN